MTERNALLQYLDHMTPDARDAFANRAGSSYSALRLAANGYKTGGKLQLSPEFAARIEKADLTGTLHRAALSPTCAACPYSGCAKK